MHDFKIGSEFNDEIPGISIHTTEYKYVCQSSNYGLHTRLHT